jgi:hypothetical protein
MGRRWTAYAEDRLWLADDQQREVSLLTSSATASWTCRYARSSLAELRRGRQFCYVRLLNPHPMFGLFKKRQPAAPSGEPHPQHRNFARMFIPGSLAPERRSGFLAAMSDAQASQTLQEAWQKFGARVLPPELLMPPAGLSASGFRHDKFLCFLIIFPPPKVPVRYFILERSVTDTPAIFEWRPSATEDDEIFDSLGPGPSPQHPPDFTALILSRFYGYDPAA